MALCILAPCQQKHNCFNAISIGCIYVLAEKGLKHVVPNLPILIQRDDKTIFAARLKDSLEHFCGIIKSEANMIPSVYIDDVVDSIRGIWHRTFTEAKVQSFDV